MRCADSVRSGEEIIFPLKGNLISVNGTFIDSHTYKQGDKDIDIMRTGNSDWFVVTEKAKVWIGTNCDQWTEFWDLDDLPY